MMDCAEAAMPGRWSWTAKLRERLTKNPQRFNDSRFAHDRAAAAGRPMALSQPTIRDLRHSLDCYLRTGAIAVEGVVVGIEASVVA